MYASSIIFLFAAALASSVSANIIPEQVALQSEGTVHATASWKYDNCGLESDSIQVESIVVSPDPPKPGANLTVTVNALVTQTLEDGAYADVLVKLGLIKLLQKRFDVCEEARNANASVQCPVEPGHYTVVHTVELPKEIPPAKFTVNVNGYSVDDEDLVCLKLFADFTKGHFLNIGW